MKWDLFICHASEDKEDFVRPLACALRELGLRVWYDEFALTLGDSIRRSIERGLAESRYGLVVLSPAFLRKEWARRELDALVAKETNENRVILPVWHKVGIEDVRQSSLLLADRLAISSAAGVDEVAKAVSLVVGKDQNIQILPAQPATDENSVDISVRRESRHGGSSNPFDIYLDEKLVVKIENGKTVAFKTTPGPHGLRLAYKIDHPPSGPRDPVGSIVEGISQVMHRDFLSGEWVFECGYEKGFLAFWKSPSPLFLRLLDFKPLGK